MKLLLLLASLYTLIFYQGQKIEKHKDIDPLSKEILKPERPYLQIAADEKDKNSNLWIRKYNASTRYPG